MDKIIHLIYVSSSKQLIDDGGLLNLMKSIRARNKAHNITGMLLYNDGSIMQLIEGKETDVLKLYENILSDSRHTGIIELVREEISQRDFSKWAMSYKNISGLKIDGFSDFMSFGSFPNESDTAITRAKKLLISFRG